MINLFMLLCYLHGECSNDEDLTDTYSYSDTEVAEVPNEFIDFDPEEYIREILKQYRDYNDEESEDD
jgi:hypothetical protein